jgi:hypothetical protein
MSQEQSNLFTRLAPVLNVSDLAAERAFYEKLGVPVIYEGPEYPDFIGFGTETLHFGIQEASAANDPPSVLTWQIGVTDIDGAMERCWSADPARSAAQSINFDSIFYHRKPGRGAKGQVLPPWARSLRALREGEIRARLAPESGRAGRSLASRQDG